MRVTLWGTRGSLASPGPETVRYGGNTACVEVRGADGSCLVLDAGTGIRRLGAAIGPETERVDVLLTHLHMDHVQGLGFFAPLYRPGLEVHLWGPASATQDLGARLARYLSPPLFPVRLRDLPCRLSLHDVSSGSFAVGEIQIQADRICHPGVTLGYRLSEAGRAMAYLSDHEVALGVRDAPASPEWTSGFALAAGVDLLLHDAQYRADEYEAHVGWGHSTLPQAIAFAALAGARTLVPFHHDPAHDDPTLDRMLAEVREGGPLPVELAAGTEGASFSLPP